MRECKYVPFLKDIVCLNYTANGNGNTAAYREDLLVVDVDFDLFGSLDFKFQILHRPVFFSVVHRRLDRKFVSDGLLAGALPHLIAA